MIIVQLGRELHLIRAVRPDSKNSGHHILHTFLGIFYFVSVVAPIPSCLACSHAKAMVFIFLRLSTVKFRIRERSVVITIKQYSIFVKKISISTLLGKVHRRQLAFLLRRINTWLSGNKTQLHSHVSFFHEQKVVLK